MSDRRKRVMDSRPRQALEHRLTHISDLRIPGFLKSVAPGTIYQRTFAQTDTEGWFDGFCAHLRSSLGKRFVPVYRMADGEFMYCVGRRWRLRLRPWHRLPHKFSAFLGAGSRKFTGAPFSTASGESYSNEEREMTESLFIAALRRIASRGFLAVNFYVSESGFAEQYFIPQCRWFDRHGVPLTEENYVPHFFVYALLCGPRARSLVAGQRILVLTGDVSAKRECITKGLEELGAAEVRFHELSATKAMLDEVDAGRYAGTVDLALVGAGIGSAMILAQLEPLQTVCIDAGAALGAIGDPVRRTRLFMVPDP